MENGAAPVLIPEAISLVGPERYRLWTTYLAGVSFSFADGSLSIFQVIATKHHAKGPSGIPGNTRGPLFAGSAVRVNGSDLAF